MIQSLNRYILEANLEYFRELESKHCSLLTWKMLCYCNTNITVYTYCKTLFVYNIEFLTVSLYKWLYHNDDK